MKTAAVSVALQERDLLTGEHCDRVAGLAVELGQCCALSDRELQLLRLSAVLHDVGKIGIPDAVLKKIEPLTAADWAIMKTHSEKSERIVLAADLDGGDLVARVVRHHHERYDGTGYPDGISGEAIPVMSRILAIADTYDAMARTRVYRQAQPHPRIMRALHDVQGRQHDPYLFRKFAQLIETSQFRTSLAGSSDDRAGHTHLIRFGH